MSRRIANPARGEAALLVNGTALVIRPSFAALVAAEAELGSLLALVERAADGRLTLAESATLLFHCIADRPDSITRDAVGEALIGQGLGASTPLLRVILSQIVAGSG